MSHRPADHPLDLAARRAFRQHCNSVGGYEPVRAFFELDHRTVARMYSGKRAVPPRIAAQLAEAYAFDGRASPEAKARGEALRAWAEHCRRRQDAAPAATGESDG